MELSPTWYLFAPALHYFNKYLDNLMRFPDKLLMKIEIAFPTDVKRTNSFHNIFKAKMTEYDELLK